MPNRMEVAWRRCRYAAFVDGGDGIEDDALKGVGCGMIGRWCGRM